MTISDIVAYMKVAFPAIKFYNGRIDSNEEQCAGIYVRGNAQTRMALGGIANMSYNVKPIQILVHWGQNSDDCDIIASSLYDNLCGLCNFTMNGKNVRCISMLDPCPIDLGRDEHGICEMTFRFEIYYGMEA